LVKIRSESSPPFRTSVAKPTFESPSMSWTKAASASAFSEGRDEIVSEELLREGIVGKQSTRGGNLVMDHVVNTVHIDVRSLCGIGPGEALGPFVPEIGVEVGLLLVQAPKSRHV
jgi:hypothetical protein